MEILRRQIAAQKSDSRNRSAGRQGVAGSAPTRAPMQALRTRIHERITGLDISGADRRTAGRVFLESVLAWEFGDDLIGDPRFDEMLREVHDTIDADPKLRNRFHELLQQIARQAPAR